MDLRSGAVIAGRYRVDRKVGAGGMGEVWSGEHLAIGSRIALKTMLPAAALNHEVVARFKREAFLLGKVRSDYVARVVDFVADDAHGLVLVMEFVDGQSLARLLTERILTVEETIELGFDLANALTDLHRSHIVHRDLKPGNVILSRTADGGTRAVLVDFGVSRLLNPTEKDEETITGITRADMAVGTIEYMSPEQILNSRSVTAASDIYAVGAILYRAVCGRHVFGDVQSETELAQLKLTTEGAPLSLPGRADRLALGLRDAVTRALKRRPSERIKTAEELLAAFTPLRDLVRVNALDLDSTTEDVHENFLEPTTKKPRDSLVSISDVGPMPLPPHPSQPQLQVPMQPHPHAQQQHLHAQPQPPQPHAPAQAVAASPPERRGVPIAFVLGAVLGALVAGAGATFFLVSELQKGDAAEASSTKASAAASQAPAATAAPVASAAVAASAEPKASAEPSAVADAEPAAAPDPVEAPSATAAVAPAALRSSGARPIAAAPSADRGPPPAPSASAVAAPPPPPKPAASPAPPKSEAPPAPPVDPKF